MGSQFKCKADPGGSWRRDNVAQAGMSIRGRPRANLIAKYLALSVLAGLLDVGRGNHEPSLPCEVLEAVNLAPDGSPSVFRREFNPGRFSTMNFDSPDSTVRWVLDYSEVADFSNLAPLNVQLPLFDKRTYISSSGRDLESDFILDPRGKVRGGRFVFTKSTPADEFSFPQSRQLENGVDYYFKHYKVRDGCVSPPLDMHTRYPSEVLTRPTFLQSRGFPSAVRRLQHVKVNTTSIEMSWLFPWDSGNNRTTYANGSMEVGYMVTATPVAATAPNSGPALKAGAVELGSNVRNEGIVMKVLQGQLYKFNVVVNNSMGFSSTETLLGRAVGPPKEPRDLAFRINPFNLTNATGNRNGSLSWKEPFDAGLGVPCGPTTLWTGCREYPLRVDRYRLKRVYGPTAGNMLVDINLAKQPSFEKQVDVAFETGYYKFAVAAGNKQDEVVGNFSALGREAVTSNTPDGLLSGPPVSMRLLYSPWLTNVSGVGVGVAAETVEYPTQARGISDYCYFTNGSQGGKCPADDSVVDAGWVPPAECGKCKDPELSVFVDSVYTFKVRAVKNPDFDFAEYDPNAIVIENNLAEVLGPEWQTMASLNYSTFRCAAKSSEQHWSDQAACDAVNRTNYLGGVGRSVMGYGWKEVKVAFTATKAMASRAEKLPMCFTAITPSNKRSRMCINVGVIRPDPQFFDFTLNHNVTMGCVFTTDVTAEDRTELRLSRATALEKNYLVGISSIGGRIESLYRSTPFPALPVGARLFPQGLTMATNNSITYRFQWTPKRFQEGFTYVVNLQARGFLGDTPVPGVPESPLREISLVINVMRCRFCTENPNEISLSTLASEWRASWLSIWSGNHVLVDVDTVEETTVQLGPVLKVASTQACDRATLGDMCNDDLAHISSRYGVSVQDLLWWNPDLSDEAGRKNNYQLFQDQEICVLPNTCVNTGHIYSGGF